MNQEDKVQQYQQALQEKVKSLNGVEQELAGYVAEMAGFTYLREDEKAYLNADVLLKRMAAEMQAPLFRPLLDVLEHLVSEPFLARFRYIAERAANFPYSKNYERRPFRTIDPEQHIGQVFRKMIALFRIEMHGFSLNEYVSMREYKFDYLHEIRAVIPDCIAYELDHETGDMKQALHDIIYGDNQNALLTTEMIKGIFMSDQVDAYQMVGELLIAARLQEGLRQSIVERMDEGTLEAYIYILKIIIDNNLIRFSSVVRALAVWTGIGIEAANQRVAAQLITQAHQALTDPAVREEWQQSANANQLFISLWATAVIEENELERKVIQIMDHGQVYQQIVAQYVLANSQNRGLRLHIARQYLEVQDLELLHWVIENYDAMYMFNWSFENGENQRSVHVWPLSVFEDKAVRRRDFDLFKQMLTHIPQGGDGGPSGVLEFVQYRIDPDDVVKKMLYLAAYDMDPEWIGEVIALKDKLSPDLRGELLSQFVHHPEIEVQRQFIFDSLSDKSMNNRENALIKAKLLTLTVEELLQMEALLKLKTGTLRQKIIQVMLLQPADQLMVSLKRLLQSKSELQRLGALELLTEVSADPQRSEQQEQMQPLIELIKKPTAKEQKLLDKLTEQSSRYTEANGFGLYDPSWENPLLHEERDLGGFKPKDVFTLSLEKAKQFLEGLDALVHEHRDHEYEAEYYAGYKETLLVGATLRAKVYTPYDQRQDVVLLEQFPLHNIWGEYVQKSGLDNKELLQMLFAIRLEDLNKKLDDYYRYYSTVYEYGELEKHWLLEGWRKEFAEEVYPVQHIQDMKKVVSELRYADQVKTLIEAIYEDSDRSDTFEIAERTLYALMKMMPEEQMEKESGMLALLSGPWFYIVRDRVHDDNSFKRYFQTLSQFDQLNKDSNRGSFLTLNDYLRAYELGFIDAQEVYKQLLVGESRALFIRELTSSRNDWIAEKPMLAELRRTVVERILEIELTRGELSTEVSTLAMKLERIEGMEHWVHLVAAMDQDTFVRGYIYSYGDNTTRKETFSHLIQVCHPRDGEDELLGQLLAKHPIQEKKLLEAAMYAPQWMEIVAKHLGWEGLRSAAWYFHAHINERFTAEKETIVAHYSPITPQDFNEGAFDIAWFEEAYEAVGEERFSLLYDCAKYISGGANHRRSQLFADAALGKLKLEDMRESVEEKRNKDHLLTYSLIPFAEEKEQDLRERYDFIQKFLMQSKQFGAQRRASEGLVSQIALGNLARNAGYADVTRLMWDMEARKLDEMKSYFEPHELDEATTAQLAIDEEGQPELLIVSKGKTLKSVPARFKKDGYIAELKELKTDLVDQYRRAKQELERSMTAGTSFTSEEVSSLLQNPVLRPLVRTLVLQADDKLGRFDVTSGGLITPGSDDSESSIQTLTEQNRLLIAHPLHLFQSGSWSEFQRDLFNRQERQPFKQVFRELYLPNEDELANGTVSRRYAGYQIQPKKAVALLKGRQWTVSYEEGLQKVSYEHNLIANLYAMADWFSPADTEAPTLETVQFYDRRTYKPVALKDVPPVFFSEVMRDIDLVVSVAHVGGVDPEASLTTIEMRHVIVNESLRLLKIDNVRLDGNYARIDGELGEYAVHLGSGNVFKQATGALHIVPVHSQHRGRIFLPFLDEDPRTAEILSKVMLLAEDKKIKDPQILAQLQH